MSFDPPDPTRRRGPLAWTFAVSAAIGLASLGLVHHLAQTLARPARFAGTLVEPEVTGSIVSPAASSVVAGARSVVLDSCAGGERLVVRGPGTATGSRPLGGKRSSAD